MPPIHITNALDLPGNGIAVTVADFAVALGGGVLQFECWTGAQTDAALRAEAAATITRIPARSPLPGKWLPARAKRAAAQAVRDADLLVAHSFFQEHVAWTRKTARQKNIPYWLVPSGVLDPSVFEKNTITKQAWMKLWGASILRDASAIICATHREAAKIQERHGLDNLHVIHWPVDLPDLAKRDAARNALRQRHKLDPDTRILLFLGRLHPSKQPVETVRSFLAADCKHTVLILAGPDDGPAAEAARAAAGGSARILFTGMVRGPEKEELLLGADGFVSLSLKENFGYTTAESLAAGLPVILSPGHDLAPELAPANCGWFLKSVDEEEAVETLRAFDQAAEEALVSMGMRGRTWAEKNLSREQFQKRSTDIPVRETEHGHSCP